MCEIDWECKGPLNNGCQEFKVTPVNMVLWWFAFSLFSKYVHRYKCRVVVVGGELGLPGLRSQVNMSERGKMGKRDENACLPS